jgi:single-stranded-DNA-specific exonuclease
VHTLPADDPQGAARRLFRQVLEAADPAEPVLVLGHFDADGLSALAILVRALERAGRRAAIRIVGRGENPWSDEMRAELAEADAGAVLVTDLGVREGALKPGTPTAVIDHHQPTGMPDGAVVISGNGMDPEPTSALLAYWCAQALGPADDLVWLAAIGLIGDMAEGVGWPELTDAQTRFGKTALRDAVSLLNAPRRAAGADAGPSLALLLKANGPKEILSGVHPETAQLRAAKAEVAAALDAAKRIGPKVGGDVALIRFHSPCQIHPLIAQQWRGRLKDKIVLAANTGYRRAGSTSPLAPAKIATLSPSWPSVGPRAPTATTARVTVRRRAARSASRTGTSSSAPSASPKRPSPNRPPTETPHDRSHDPPAPPGLPVKVMGRPG